MSTIKSSFGVEMGMIEAQKELTKRLKEQDIEADIEYPKNAYNSERYVDQGFKTLQEYILSQVGKVYTPKPDISYKEKCKLLRLIYNRSKKMFYNKQRSIYKNRLEDISGDRLQRLLDELNQFIPNE
jgi:hypothetical protein